MTKSDRFAHSLKMIYTSEIDLTKYYNQGHIHGMIDAAFDLPDWVDGEHFTEFLVRANLNPFATSLEECLAEYETYEAELFMD